MTTTRFTTLRAEVIRADPDWPVTSRIHVEYEFSSRGANPRGFKADYRRRGIYPEADDEE